MKEMIIFEINLVTIFLLPARPPVCVVTIGLGLPSELKTPVKCSTPLLSFILLQHALLSSPSSKLHKNTLSGISHYMTPPP